MRKELQYTDPHSINTDMTERQRNVCLPPTENTPSFREEMMGVEFGRTVGFAREKKIQIKEKLYVKVQQREGWAGPDTQTREQPRGEW